MRDDVEVDPKVVETTEAAVRFLVGKTDMTWEYEAGVRTDLIDVYVDSDWAGDRQPRKSISGGLMIVGGDSGQELVT